MRLYRQSRQGKRQPAHRQVRNSGAAIAVAGLLLYASSSVPAATLERLSAELVLCGGLLSGIGQRAHLQARRGTEKRADGPAGS